MIWFMVIVWNKVLFNREKTGVRREIDCKYEGQT